MKSVGVILAGGGSRRMGGNDKAAAVLHGRRLVEIVFDRISAQADVIIVSGKEDYGLTIPSVPDQPKWPGGPVGGIFSAFEWARENCPEAEGLLTIPVDGPRFPEDLGARLKGDRSAVAAVSERLHPTFAWWSLAELIALESAVADGDIDSLKGLARQTNARIVPWDDPALFANINTPADLEAWNLQR